jgi:hypothetical protein
MIWSLVGLGQSNVAAMENDIDSYKPAQHKGQKNANSPTSLREQLDKAKSIKDQKERNAAFQSLITDYRTLANSPASPVADKFRNLSNVGYAWYAKAEANRGLTGEKEDYKQAFENFVFAYHFFLKSKLRSRDEIPYVPARFVNFHGFLGRAYYKYASLTSDEDEKGVAYVEARKNLMLALKTLVDHPDLNTPQTLSTIAKIYLKSWKLLENTKLGKRLISAQKPFDGGFLLTQGLLCDVSPKIEDHSERKEIIFMAIDCLNEASRFLPDSHPEMGDAYFRTGQELAFYSMKETDPKEQLNLFKETLQFLEKSTLGITDPTYKGYAYSKSAFVCYHAAMLFQRADKEKLMYLAKATKLAELALSNLKKSKKGAEEIPDVLAIKSNVEKEICSLSSKIIHEE